MRVRLLYPTVSAILAVTCLVLEKAKAEQSGDFTYQDNGDSVTITAYPVTAAGPVEIPSEIAGKPVTSIGIGAFKSCIHITSVGIPDSVTTIGSQAFINCSAMTGFVSPPLLKELPNEMLSRCSSLTSVTLPANLTTIGENAISYTSLESIEIPESVKEIKRWAFFETKLSSVTIPEGITIINQGTFSYCSRLTTVNLPLTLIGIDSYGFSSCPILLNVNLPESLRFLGFGTFWKCSELRSIRLPSQLTSIPDICFASCINLKTISIPNACMSIGSRSFDKCTELKTVTIGTGVSTAGDGAFGGCTNLTSVHFLGNSPTLGERIFGSTYPNLSIYYNSKYIFYASSTWSFVRKVRLVSPTAITTWLIANRQHHDSAITSDSNNDGVTLLMAYALDLDPTQNLGDALPRPIMKNGRMDISFFSAAEGVSYTVEASTDLANWNTEDVVLSAPDAHGRTTGSYTGSSSAAYLRVIARY